MAEQTQRRMMTWGEVACQKVEQLPDDPDRPATARFRVSGFRSLADFDGRFKSAMARVDVGRQA